MLTTASTDIVPAAMRKPRGKSQARGRALAAAVDLAELRRAYEDGASTVDLALAHGISRTTVRALLDRAGCRRRTVREAAGARARPSYVRRAPPEPVQDPYPVVDVFGVAWRVTFFSRTMHGFEILLGLRVKGHRGRAAVIVTAPLAAHLDRHRLGPRALALPLGQSLITRLRHSLDLDWARENAAWWAARREDLDRLPSASFAARHGIPEATAMAMRRRLCGVRPPRKPPLDDGARAVLLSDRPGAEIAAALGQTVSMVYRLRSRLRREARPDNRKAATTDSIADSSAKCHAGADDVTAPWTYPSRAGNPPDSVPTAMRLPKAGRDRTARVRPNRSAWKSTG